MPYFILNMRYICKASSIRAKVPKLKPACSPWTPACKTIPKAACLDVNHSSDLPSIASYKKPG